jgi:hypothetical protein
VTADFPPPSLDDMTETCRAYDGPLEMREELISFEVGDTVTFKRLMP